jgi:coenzyme F420-reducing hydrogenase delta subunit
MCTGRLEPQFILKAFELGADGVLIAGCHIGECHYITGNERAKVKVAMSKELLDVLGLDSRRLRLEWISASEGIKFAKTMDDFTKQLVELGPNPLRGGKK